MASADVRIETLGVSFRNEQVLEEISLEIEDGEFCVIVGPSGCGKSTLLQTIAGLNVPDTGGVYLRDQDASTMSVQKRNLGYVFQEFEDALFPHMTVGENVAFGVRQKEGEVDENELQSRIDEVLDMLSIGHTKGDYPSELSGGQQQRVELARQLIREPSTMLLDDPLADLDYKLQKQMELEIRQIQNELGSTFLYVTHNQDQALKLADKLVVMNRGRLEQIGTPEEVYNEPTNAFVGRFIGDSNAMRATVEQSTDDGLVVETPIGSIEATNMTGAETGDDGVLLVRPGTVELHADDGYDTTLEATPLGTTYMGETTEIALSVDGYDGDFYVIVPDAVELDADSLRIGFDTADAQFFDEMSASDTVTTNNILEL